MHKNLALISAVCFGLVAVRIVGYFDNDFLLGLLVGTLIALGIFSGLAAICRTIEYKK